MAVWQFPQRKFVVEFGSRFINGRVRDLFEYAEYLGIDLVDGPEVDIVADAEYFIPSKPPDTVVCCSVLEHTPRGRQIVANAYRILTDGGILILTAGAPPMPSHSASDGLVLGVGEYYSNVSLQDLASWLGIFERSSIIYDGRTGDIFAWAIKGA